MVLKPGDSLHIWTTDGKTLMRINSRDGGESLIFISDVKNPAIQTDLIFKIDDDEGQML